MKKLTEIDYTCCDPIGSKWIDWKATVKILNEDEPYELSVKAQDNLFQVILGKYEYGVYICIPNYNIGCALPSEILTSCIGIAECLSVAGLSPTNAITVAGAIRTVRWQYSDLLPNLTNLKNLTDKTM